MQKARKRLGRGLSALIPDADMEFLSRVARGELPPAPSTESENDTQKVNKPGITSPPRKPSRKTPSKKARPLSPDSGIETDEGQVEYIPIRAIEPNPYQPRRTFSAEELEELSQSIAEHGVLQPILVRPVPVPVSSKQGSSAAQGIVTYQLIAGERRWRASMAANLERIPAIIRHVTDRQTLEIAVIENLQRHDISPVDAALAYRRLSEEFSLSQEEIARRVGKSRAAIANTLRLLDLPKEVLQAIDDGQISEGHGRAILLAAGDGARRAVFRRVIREKLSVRQTEELARTLTEKDELSSSSQDARGPHLPPEIRRIEETLQKKLGTRVRLRTRKVGGQLTVEYFSNEELERLLKILMR